jgi:hypothetical protein
MSEDAIDSESISTPGTRRGEAQRPNGTPQACYEKWSLLR